MANDTFGEITNLEYAIETLKLNHPKPKALIKDIEQVIRQAKLNWRKGHEEIAMSQINMAKLRIFNSNEARIRLLLQKTELDPRGLLHIKKLLLTAKHHFLHGSDVTAMIIHNTAREWIQSRHRKKSSYRP